LRACDKTIGISSWFALRKSNLIFEINREKELMEIEKTTQTDAVIIGGGLAGLTAAAS